ncbi:extracellular solute-binding protein [Paenibacillus cremeus]|uniref:Extracellular solute-binding protein n=1 Tax=Paenibacillus cremeus TaxID=2163881 RepID=A0A559K8L8_9BACL|nr:extracellular solute-binding protein [Paenibacillus cremeus]TVY08476.1 extracellular solute-binding protein [Paenibacillus cremeus]
MSKKMLSSMAAMTLLVGALSGCGGGDSSKPQDQAAKPGDTANKEERTLRVMANVIGGKTPEENTQFEQEVKRLTGITVKWEKPSADYDQKMLAAISSGEKFDLLQVSKEKMNILMEQGVLQPLDAQIKASKTLSDPNVLPTGEWEQVKAKDGKIYGVFTKFQGGTMPIIREDWVQKLGLKDPNTLDEYYNVLKAFKEKDPDGNGKADTYGLTFSGKPDLYELQGFFSAAGLKQRYVVQDGKKVVPYATDAAVPVWQWLNKLYKEGIIDPDFVNNDTGKMRNLFLGDRAGMITYWDAWVGTLNSTRLQQDPNTKFQAKGLPGVPGPDGKYMLRRGDPDVWIIPVNAPHPKTAFEFIEWWHSKDGITLGSIGIKDVDYKDNGGKLELTEQGKAHAQDHGTPFWYNKNVPNPFGLLPGVKEAQELVVKYATLEQTPSNWADANKIINTYGIKAITGELPAADAVKKMRDELKAQKLID